MDGAEENTVVMRSFAGRDRELAGQYYFARAEDDFGVDCRASECARGGNSVGSVIWRAMQSV
jgi:hypothetical protein